MKGLIEIKLKELINSKLSKLKLIIVSKLESLKKLLIPYLLKIKSFFISFARKLYLDKFYHISKLDKIVNKIKNIDKHFYLEILAKTFTLIAIPLIIYLYCQLFCDGKLIFEEERMKLNFIFIYFIIGFFYCICGKIKVGLYLSMVLTFIVGIVNYFITTFRGTPLVPWDIFSVNVALTVLPTFKIVISKKCIIGILLFLLGIFILHKIKFKSFKNGKLKIVYRLIALIIVTFIHDFYFTDMIKEYELDENWDPKEEYHNNGLIASLFKQSRNLIITTPEGYDIDSITELVSSIEVPLVEHDENFEYPNIIAIMNESFADLKVIGSFNTNADYLPFFNSLEKNAIKGNLHVSIFGATTPNSEWEFLTSNSMAFVPKRTVPYQQYVLRNSYSLATILKSQGYTTSAIHCYYPQGYNRNLAYPRLGFNSFWHIHTLKDLTYIREYPSDLSTYQNIISLYENKSENEKIFNFTLTMQNHGSFTDENFPNSIIASNNEYSKLNQYLSLIKLSDEALEYLINYFEEQEEPTIIVLFGDHQPYVEDEFYNTLLAKNYANPTSKEATEKRYITPFLIWANYDIDTEKYKNLTDISSNYLASLILDVANIQKTPYLEFLDNLRLEIPIITGNGYMDKNGIYHDFYEETEYTKLIENYHYLQFNNMFDTSSKITSLFEVPTPPEKQEIEINIETNSEDSQETTINIDTEENQETIINVTSNKE